MIRDAEESEVPCKRCGAEGYVEVEDIMAVCPTCFGVGTILPPEPAKPDERCRKSFLNPCDLSCDICPYVTR